MGTLGVRLFDDDTAADARDGWFERVANGESGEAATLALMVEWGDALEDPEEAIPFWLGLAETQWRAGRLEPSVRDRALGWAERDLDRWDLADRGHRQKVVAELRARLLTPPPPPKRLRRPRTAEVDTDLQAGQVAAWRLRSGRWCLLHVANIEEYFGRAPVVQVLDWVGDTWPGTLPTDRPMASRLDGWGFYLRPGSVRDGPDPNRFRVLSLELSPIVALKGGVVFTWKHLDTQLSDYYGLG